MELIHLGPYNKDRQYIHISDWSNGNDLMTSTKLILDCIPIGTKRGVHFETLNNVVSDLSDAYEERIVLLPKGIVPNDIKYINNPEGKKFIFTLSDEKNMKGQLSEYEEHYDVSGVIIPAFKERDTFLSSFRRTSQSVKRIYLLEWVSSGLVGEALFTSEYSFISGIFTERIINDSKCRMLYHPAMGRLYDVDKFFQFDIKMSSIIFNYNDYCVRCWLSGIHGMEFEEFLIGGKK